MSRSAQVNENPVEESQKKARVNGEDRVSNLPESIISHILSCLPTKDAIRTCVLSKDWEYKWTSIYNIDIDDNRDFRKNDIATMVDFVEMILLSTKNIKKFHFSCDRECTLGRRLTTWISTVLRRNVESLELVNNESGIVLPRIFTNNNSLRKLVLAMSFCIFKVPSTNYFPNLTSLCFSGVALLNEFSNTDKLIFTFPVLETLELCLCEWENVKSVEIFAPSLTTLVSITSDNSVEILDYSITIFGSKLVNFESSGGSAVNFILAGPRVVKAILEHGDFNEEELLENYGLQFRRLLKEFSSLEELKLTYWVTKVIANTKQELALPTYNKLRKLSVNSGTNIEALMELLHSAPSLTILFLQVNDYDNHAYDFDAVEFVPSCIVSHLEEVTLGCYPRATGLASFLLKNGAKLKKFRVKARYLHRDVDRDALKNAILEEVSIVPKASACVSVVVE